MAENLTNQFKEIVVSVPTKGRKKDRLITFVVQEKETNKVLLITHSTKAFSVSSAFKELPDYSTFNLIGAIAGDREFLKEKLRKPTYDELAEMAGVEQ